MDDLWYKLDNAAKIFPATYKKSAPATFKLSAILYEDIDEITLQKAVDISLQRFDIFNVQLKKGFFWFYLEPNYSKYIVKKEVANIYKSLNIFSENSFLFNVFYYGKRISLEIWHGITDANGGMEFLKAICFNYLKLKGKKIENNNTILTKEVEVNSTECEDSFIKHYNPNSLKLPKTPKSFVVKHKMKNETDLFHLMLNVDELKVNAKKYEATITEYLGGILLYSIYQTYKKDNKKNLPFVLFIPVNTRKLVSSNTLRNFMTYIRTNISNKEIELEEVINVVKKSLKEEFNKEYSLGVIRGNVQFERSMLVKLLPLNIKNIGMNLVYNTIGKGTNTMVLSNIGIVKCPTELNEYINRFEFSISPSQSLPITCGVASFNNRLVITFSSNVNDREFIKTFTKHLSVNNEVVVNTNIGGDE